MGCGLVCWESSFQPEMLKMMNCPLIGLMLASPGHVVARLIPVIVKAASTAPELLEPSLNSTG